MDTSVTGRTDHIGNNLGPNGCPGEPEKRLTEQEVGAGDAT
jgi:hypothetical protein